MRALTRRSFLKRSTTGLGLALAAPALCPASWARVRGSNEDIRVAVVGFHGHGKTHINAYLKMDGVRLVALCDADRSVLDTGVKKYQDGGREPAAFVDVRELLEKKDIDAVSTATPNHWHSLLTVWACQAGKDVCVEKPVSHNIWEGRKMVEAARKYNRIVQADLDLRSNEGLTEAVEAIQQGEFGKILLVRGFCYKRRASLGKVDGAGKVPEPVDYDLWTGPAHLGPLRRERLHYDWHWVWDTGCGEIGNNGPHQLDVCRWVLGEEALPRRVMSIGGRFGYDDDGETPNTQVAYYETESAPIIYEVRGLPTTKGSSSMDILRATNRRGGVVESGRPGRGPNTGVVVICEGGWVDLNTRTVYDRDGREVRRFQGRTDGPQPNFIKAVRSRKRADLKTDILEGHLSTCLCHMGNISHRIGKETSPGAIRERLQGDKEALESFERFQAHLDANEVDLKKTPAVLGPWLTMDSSTERFTGEFAEMANRLVKREYRKPFVIPEVI